MVFIVAVAVVLSNRATHRVANHHGVRLWHCDRVRHRRVRSPFMTTVTSVSSVSKRGYKYVAFLRPKTGSIIRIRAGCRSWKSFERAFRHYHADNPHGPLCPKRWSDDWLLKNYNHALPLWMEHRRDAQRTLRDLECGVRERRNEIRRKRRK